MIAAERDEARRDAWREAVRGRDARRFVFVDECATTIGMTRLRGWAPKDERLVAAVPRNHGTPTSLIAALTPQGFGPAMLRPGAIDAPAFAAYVRKELAPTLEPGQVVIFDNLSVHKDAQVRALIEARGCEVLDLPPYSPDFTPIENAFSKFKALLRQAAARIQDDLDKAIALALDQITSADARAFFRHCGYPLPAES